MGRNERSFHIFARPLHTPRDPMRPLPDLSMNRHTSVNKIDTYVLSPHSRRGTQNLSIVWYVVFVLSQHAEIAFVVSSSATSNNNNKKICLFRPWLTACASPSACGPPPSFKRWESARSPRPKFHSGSESRCSPTTKPDDTDAQPSSRCREAWTRLVRHPAGCSAGKAEPPACIDLVKQSDSRSLRSR